MTKHIALSLAFGLLALYAQPSYAAGASCDEAQAMLTKAVELIKAEGAEKAMATFNDKAGGFIDRDLYVFVVDKSGITRAHGAKPALAGKNALIFKDADGKAFVEEFLKITDKGSVTYGQADPTDNTIKKKTSFVERVGDNFVGVGCYVQ